MGATLSTLGMEMEKRCSKLGFFSYGKPIYHILGFAGGDTRPGFLHKRMFHNSRILAITFRGEFWGEIFAQVWD